MKVKVHYMEQRYVQVALMENPFQHYLDFTIDRFLHAVRFVEYFHPPHPHKHTAPRIFH